VHIFVWAGLGLSGMTLLKFRWVGN
jgi:hypothetical protein